MNYKKTINTILDKIKHFKISNDLPVNLILISNDVYLDIKKNLPYKTMNLNNDYMFAGIEIKILHNCTNTMKICYCEEMPIRGYGM